jgi:tyrosyl-tRNA synthetase
MANIVACLKERGLLDALTSEELEERLEQPIKLYLGFDPTADSLHIGSLVGIIVLRWFQIFGHTPVVILGGATGRIGDPSGKSVERPLLDQSTILSNVTRIRRHFEEMLDFQNPVTKPIFFNNDEWFANYPLIDFLRDVGKHFRVGPLLAKESVKARLNSDEGISFTEFSYLLLQAYDFYHLRTHHAVEMEIGGSDQWGNITAGTELIRKLCGKTAFGLTFPLLTRSDGKKFGKTEEGTIWLASDRCSPYQFFQYFMRTPDADVIKMMQILTFLPMEEIRAIHANMQKKDYIPNTAQRKLAEEVTRFVHGEEGLATALKVTETAAPGAKAQLDPESLRIIAKDMPHITLTSSEVIGQRFAELALKANLVSSKGEATRLMQNGGAYLNDVRVENAEQRIVSADLIGGIYLLLGAGKKKKTLIEIRKE